MAEKQTFAEYHFKPEEVLNALREAGYVLPDAPGDLPKFRIGCQESEDTVVLRYESPVAYDPIWIEQHAPFAKPVVGSIGTDLSVVVGDDLSQTPNT